FSVPEQDLAEIKKYMAARKLQVRASVSHSEDYAATGELTFIDNTVDVTTGTIQLKAEFPNKDRNLWPGQFSNVVMTLTQQPGAVVVPFEAVQTGQQGQYVFVLRPDSTVEYRLVTAGRTVDNEMVIVNGLAPGEAVVTDGHLRLGNDSRVKVIQNGNSQ
ncbi:MAG: efflux RND transporter periplasmic adaptor subunit, partial [Desulfobacteraceae bacterium]|nr:efflux RND transporter periplasmic adaptor subunit [Desulfobacteraceae bacterium]